jgi:hypothetical protein
MYGVTEANALMTLEAGKLLQGSGKVGGTGALVQSAMPTQPVNPKNSYLGNVCARLISTGHDFEAKLADRVKPINNLERCWPVDIEQALYDCNVQLDHLEK